MRLARCGRANRPFFRVVVADKRMPRDGRHLEKLGTYDPLPTADAQKIVSLNFARVQYVRPENEACPPADSPVARARRYWLSVGAQPSSAVARLLGQVGASSGAPSS